MDEFLHLAKILLRNRVECRVMKVIDITDLVMGVVNVGVLVGIVCIAMAIYCIWFGLWRWDIKRTRERLLRENKELGNIKYNVPYKNDSFDEVMFIGEPSGYYNGTVVFSCVKGMKSTRYQYDKKGMQLISMMIKDGTYKEID